MSKYNIEAQDETTIRALKIEPVIEWGDIVASISDVSMSSFHIFRLVSPVVKVDTEVALSATHTMQWTRALQSVPSVAILTATMGGYLNEVVGSGVWQSTPRSSADFVIQGATGLRLADVARRIYGLWGMEGVKVADITYGRANIIEWCNSAIQLMYQQAARLEYFNRTVISVTVPNGNPVTLPANVQRIHGDCRVSNRALRSLESRQQVEQFAAIIGELSSPMAFFVESQFVSGGADSLELSLYLVPEPPSAVTAALDVTLAPPRWYEHELLSQTVIALPHAWIETIFLPLVKKWAMADGIMPASRRAAVGAEIDQQYRAAMAALGLADIQPQPKGEPAA